MLKNNKDGFTLIELLVVIAIIGLLSTLAIVALNSAREKSRDNIRLSDLKQVQTALEIYYTDNNSYPIAPNGVVLGNQSASCLNSAQGFSSEGCEDAIMANIPSDPQDNNYIYTSASGTTYAIQATLEGEANGLQPGLIQVSPSGIQNDQ